MTAEIVLRDFRARAGSSYVAAAITAAGDLLIEGHDLGDLAERALGTGYREYEWTIIIRAADLPALRTALADADVLTALQKRFGERTAGLTPFLEQHAIRSEFWARRGE